MEKEEFLCENLKELSQAQYIRKKEIDNKVNILLTIVLAMLGILIGFADKKEEVAGRYNNGISIWNFSLVLIIILCYISAIVISVILIIKLVLILKSKKYRVIKAEKVANQNYIKKDNKEILKDFIETYSKNINENSGVNEKQMNIYAHCVVLFIIDLFFVIATYIGIMIIK